MQSGFPAVKSIILHVALQGQCSSLHDKRWCALECPLETVSTKLFDCTGVAGSSDEDVMDNRVADTMQYVRQNAGDTADYSQRRILPKIASNNRLQWQQTWLGQHSRSNNNCESVNHVLKLQVCKYTMVISNVVCYAYTLTKN